MKMHGALRHTGRTRVKLIKHVFGIGINCLISRRLSLHQSVDAGLGVDRAIQVHIEELHLRKHRGSSPAPASFLHAMQPNRALH